VTALYSYLLAFISCPFRRLLFSSKTMNPNKQSNARVSVVGPTQKLLHSLESMTSSQRLNDVIHFIQGCLTLSVLDRASSRTAVDQSTCTQQRRNYKKQAEVTCVSVIQLLSNQIKQCYSNGLLH
jgi:hypothetical protein